MQNQLTLKVLIEGSEDVHRNARMNELRIANLVLEFYSDEAYQDFRESMAEALELVHPDELTGPEAYSRWRGMKKATAVTVAV